MKGKTAPVHRKTKKKQNNLDRVVNIMAAIDCLEPTPFRVLLVVISYIVIFLTLLLVIHGSFHILRDKKQTITFKIVYFSCNILWLCGVTGYSFAVLLPITKQCLDPLDKRMFLGFYGYNFGWSALYLLFFLRLHAIYHDTEFKLSHFMLVFLWTGAVFPFILGIFTGYYFEVNAWDKAYVTGTVWLFLTIFYSMGLLFVFIRKLYQLYSMIFINHNRMTVQHTTQMEMHANRGKQGKQRTKQQPTETDTLSTTGTFATSNQMSSSAPPDESEHFSATKASELTPFEHEDTATVWTNLNENNHPDEKHRTTCLYEDAKRDLLAPTVKYTMCVIGAVLSTFGNNFLIIYRGWIAGPDENQWNLFHLDAFTNVFDGFMNVFMLHLQFSYLSKLYRCVCNPCDKATTAFVLKRL